MWIYTNFKPLNYSQPIFGTTSTVINSLFDYFNLKNIVFLLESLLIRTQRNHTTMATLSEEKPKKEPGQSSYSDQTSHPQATATGQSHPQPQPTTNYPNTMGYPPVMGYPYPQAPQGYASSHIGYPPNEYSSYAYSQTPTQSNVRRNSTFVHLVLLIMAIVALFAVVSTVAIWFILRPEAPAFRVDALSVSNFNTTNFDQTANWEANITVENPNQKLKVYFNEIKSYVDYKDRYLTQSFVSPLSLEVKEHVVMNVKLSVDNVFEPVVDQKLVDDMALDRSRGSLIFRIRLMVSATFRRGSWWKKSRTLKIRCEGLEVEFAGGAGVGTLPVGKSWPCLIFV